MKILRPIAIFGLIILLSQNLMLGQKAEIRRVQRSCFSKEEPKKEIKVLPDQPNFSKILTENCQKISIDNLLETSSFFRFVAF